MDPLQNVRDTAKYLTAKAQHVTINSANLDKHAAVIAKDVWNRLSTIETGAVTFNGPASLDQIVSNDGFVESLLIEWDNESVHFRNEKESELSAQYILVLSALNFCFWQGAIPGSELTKAQANPAYAPQAQSFEYADLAGSLKDVIKQNPFAFEAQTLQKCSEETLFQWFKQRQVPLASERARLLREIGYELIQKYNGSCTQLIQQAKKSATKLVSLITASFPGFRDHCIDPVTGKQLFFYKRAQIFVADLWGSFQGKGLGEFTDIHKLTMFADYRVPQILRHFGILEYSKELVQTIDTCQQIPHGATFEIEIRAATVECVERLKQVLEKSHRIRAKSLEIDWWLWQKGEAVRDEIPPHHRTMSIYY